MKKVAKKLVLVLTLFVLVVGAFTGCSKSTVKEKVNISINGSTTVFPIAQKASEVYMNKHPNVNITVEGTGSGNGIAALIDGICDIASSSREVKQSEFDNAKAKGITLNPIPIALDAISIVVHPSNPVNNLTKEQVADIFTGKITNWKDVGGKDAEIVVVSRDTSSGTYGTFMELALPKDAKITDKALYQSSNATVRSTVATTENAIGYIGLGYVDNSVKAVSYNGVAPSKENVKNKTYGLSRELFLIVNGEPTGEIKNFIDFVLSDEGQAIVEQEGFIRIR